MVDRKLRKNKTVSCYKIKEKLIIAYGLQMGNNLLTTAGAIALAKAINESESSEMEELDLTVRVKAMLNIMVNFLYYGTSI